MVIILEGPDGAGKTTLLEALKAEMARLEYRYTFVHHGAYLGESDIAHHYTESLHASRNVLMDRSWLAEPIYGNAVRGGHSRLSDHDVTMIEREAYFAGACAILCLPPFEVCAKAWASRPEDEYLKRKLDLENVYVGYTDLRYEWHAVTTLPLLCVYDWTAERPPSAADLITYTHKRVGGAQ